MRRDTPKKALRSFGFIVGGGFAAIGLFPALFRGKPPHTWALVVAALLAGVAAVFPAALAPVHRVWMAAGHFLGFVNTRIILFLIYYLVFTPVGVAKRMFGYDPMRRRFDRKLESYRIPKRPRPAAHMERQF